MPQNVMIQANSGDTVLDAALDHEIFIAHECGGNCACTTCLVHVIEGMENLSAMEPAEEDRLATVEHLPSARLSCQALVRDGAICIEL